MNRTLWFDRTFHLGLPVDVLPNILERLRGTSARLEETIHSLPSTILTEKTDGKWSIQEHVGHLWDLEDLHDGRIDDFLNRATSLRPADLYNAKTNNANHNAAAVDTLLASFRKSRQHFVQRIETLDEATLHHLALHPRLKEQMRVVDMAYFVAEHDDHHLASIRERARALLSQR